MRIKRLFGNRYPGVPGAFLHVMIAYRDHKLAS